MRIFIWFLIVQIHESFGTKDTLNVCVLLEMTQYRYSKYYTFFNDIIGHVFEEVTNRTDIHVLTEYSLNHIPKDTQVTNVV